MYVQKVSFVTGAAGGLATAIFAAGHLVAEDPPKRSPEAPATGKGLPEGPNRLLFFRAGGLVLTDPDGKNEKKLLGDGEKHYGEARLSPDGTRLAFLVKSKAPGEGRRPKLYVRALDGKGAGTDLKVECQTFAWSPDGSRIACCDFSDDPGETPPEFKHFTVDVKTAEQKPLKIPDGHLLTDWSRDGKHYLTTQFSADPDNKKTRLARLFLVGDGVEPTALTGEKEFTLFGRFAPDGKRILHLRVSPPKDEKRRPKRELVVLDTLDRKSSVVADTPLNGELIGHCWSPDGKRIAYTWLQVPAGDQRDDAVTESHLVVCDPDGKNAKTIASEKRESGRLNTTIGRVDWR